MGGWMGWWMWNSGGGELGALRTFWAVEELGGDESMDEDDDDDVCLQDGCCFTLWEDYRRREIRSQLVRIAPCLGSMSLQMCTTDVVSRAHPGPRSIHNYSAAIL